MKAYRTVMIIFIVLSVVLSGLLFQDRKSTLGIGDLVSLSSLSRREMRLGTSTLCDDSPQDAYELNAAVVRREGGSVVVLSRKLRSNKLSEEESTAHCQHLSDDGRMMKLSQSRVGECTN
jgi:hypothetical protein